MYKPPEREDRIGVRHRHKLAQCSSWASGQHSLSGCEGSYLEVGGGSGVGVRLITLCHSRLPVLIRHLQVCPLAPQFAGQISRLDGTFQISLDSTDHDRPSGKRAPFSFNLQVLSALPPSGSCETPSFPLNPRLIRHGLGPLLLN